MECLLEERCWEHSSEGMWVDVLERVLECVLEFE